MVNIKEGYKETEFGVIPEEWQVLSLDMVFKVSSGSFLSQKNIIEGEHPVYGGNGINGYHAAYIFEEPKIVIGRVGANCGCVHISEPKSWITDNALYISEKLISFDDLFMYYKLTQLNLNKYANHNAQPVISGQKIYSISIGYPPLAEQQRIAEILYTADKQIEKLEKTIEDYKLLKAGMLKKLLSEGIGHTEFKETELGRLPKEWEVKKISEVMNIQIGGTPSRNISSYWDINKDTYNVWVSIKDLSSANKYIGDSTEYITDEGVQKSNVKLVKPDTVIMSFKLTIGTVAITKVPLYTNEAIAAFVADEDILNNQFLYYVLPTLQYETDEAIKGKTLNKQKINNTLILIPSLKEQLEIASILSQIDMSLDLYKKQREDFIRLKKALMEQLLTGKLRVNQ